MLVRAVPILDDRRKLVEWVGVHTDVDAEKRAQAAMRVARDAAEAANRSKDEFLANVSHEIRTPMNAILGMTELTLGTDLTPRQRENLVVVKSATDSLLTIINDLLDFSRMEAGKLRLDPCEFRLRDHLGDALGMLALRAHSKGLELACRIHPDVPDQLVGDPVRLRQVLVNLAGNAIKFTERGDVLVEVDVGSRDGDDIALHFRVTDTGIGVAEDKLEAIFAPFTQADGSTTRLYGGTGLGLAICSRLVDLMEGRIWVESEMGRGSTFHFTARLALAPSGRAGEPASLEDLAGLRVLVVDDNAVNRRILEELLAHWRMRPTLADRGLAALDELRRARDAGTPYSIVLLDAQMPDVDGFTLAGQIAADPTLSGATVLMLSSIDRATAADRTESARVAAYLYKPIRQLELRDAILRVVGEPPRAPEGTASPVPPPPSSAAPRRPLRILLAEDNPLNQRVAVLMLAEWGHAVTVAGDGLAAVEALARQPFDLVLMDVQMPELDGLGATAAIRAAEAGTGRRVPIIAMTAHAMAGDRDRCLEAGMDGYVTKPIQKDDLRRAIAESGPRPDGPPPPPSPQVVGPAPLDLAEALARVDGDRPFLAEMAAMFVDECPRLMAAIRGPLGAGDLAGIGGPAHSLKNWVGNFAATTAYEGLQRLEEAGRVGDPTEAAAAFAALEGEIARVSGALAGFAAGSTAPVEVSC